jgi:uncharacterized OsmC-like protein
VSDIASSRYPLVFPFVAARAEPAALAQNRVEIRTLARALAGMQKEALVMSSPSGHAWRMVCDEGPYLNGTDLAPFPLAFFTTGLVSSYFAELLDLARMRGVRLGPLEMVQDNFYTMEGSALRGDMVGGALPVELDVRIDRDVPESKLRELITLAVARSPADALLRGTFRSEFSVAKNGVALPVRDVQPWTASRARDVSDAPFDAARPDPDADFPPDIIFKLTSAATLFGVEGGLGSSLKSEQKRTLHVRGIAKQRDDGLVETHVQLFKPIGSNFRFLCDPDREASATGRRAPSPLAYLSAGVAFCYLTQIGRYVTIMKQGLDRYAIAQRTAFEFATGDGAFGTPPSAEPVRTHVAIDARIDDESVQRIVHMGERTCFLHAVARTPLNTRIRVQRSLSMTAPAGPT